MYATNYHFNENTVFHLIRNWSFSNYPITKWKILRLNSKRDLIWQTLAGETGEKIIRQERESINNSGSPITECNAIWDSAVIRGEHDIFSDCPFSRDIAFEITVLFWVLFFSYL